MKKKTEIVIKIKHGNEQRNWEMKHNTRFYVYFHGKSWKIMAGCSRDPSLRLRDHPGRMQGWESVCWGGAPYFRLINVIWDLPSPYYRLINVGWYLPSPYYRLINVLWLPFLKIKKFMVPSLKNKVPSLTKV